MFIQPTWFDGTLFYLFWILAPSLIIGMIKENIRRNEYDRKAKL